MGPEDIQRRSLQILVRPTASVLRTPLSSTIESRVPWASKWSRASVNGWPVVSRQDGDDALREGRRGVDAGADRGAAQGQLADPGEHRLEPLGGVPDRGGVAAELLSQHHRRRVHQVGAPGLHDPCELLGLALQAGGEHRERREQVVDDGQRRGDVDRGREGVVARLAGVDVVVGVYVGPVAAGEGRDHLVGVHVGAGARTGLEDVDRERVVVPAVDHRRRGRRDGRGLVVGDDAELAVDPGRGCLHPADRVDQGGFDRRTADREVLDRPLGLRPPQGVSRYPNLAHAVVLSAEVALLVAHSCDVTRAAQGYSAPDPTAMSKEC